MHEVLKGGAQSDDLLDGASPHLPIMLLSNDNAQIAAARAHGLPSFRLSSPGNLAEELEVIHSASGLLPAVRIFKLFNLSNSTCCRMRSWQWAHAHSHCPPPPFPCAGVGLLPPDCGAPAGDAGAAGHSGPGPCRWRQPAVQLRPGRGGHPRTHGGAESSRGEFERGESALPQGGEFDRRFGRLREGAREGGKGH